MSLVLETDGSCGEPDCQSVIAGVVREVGSRSADDVEAGCAGTRAPGDLNVIAWAESAGPIAYEERFGDDDSDGEMRDEPIEVWARSVYANGLRFARYARGSAGSEANVVLDLHAGLGNAAAGVEVAG